MTRRSFFLSLVALLISVHPLFGNTGERQVTKLADGVYAIQHKNLNDGNPSGNEC
jgi:hypothetical protein